MISFRDFAIGVCGLQLSPLIEAIAQASAGQTVTCIDNEASSRHFGCALAELPSVAPRTVAVRAGGRGGKTSRLLAPKALHAAWTVPLPTLQHGEAACSLIVAPDMKLGRQTLSFAAGYVEQSRMLSAALVKPPTADAIELRRPDGKVVRIEVLAASRGGRATRARTLVFAGLDEACFFFDETSGVVNDADIYHAVLQRIVPGGQCWVVSTPWVEGVGLLEGLLAENLGRHGHALVMHAATRALNPTWDPDGSIERALRAQDPDRAAREIDAIPLGGGAGTFFDARAIAQSIDAKLELPLRAEPHWSAVAAADFGFRSDSSALVIVLFDGQRYHVAELVEMRPERGKPLRPSEVAARFAAVALGFGCGSIIADQFSEEAMREHLAAAELRLEPAPPGATGKVETYTKARALLHEGRVRLPDHPRLLNQLRAVVSKPTPGGGLSITSPRKAGGGHGDIVSALVLALAGSIGKYGTKAVSDVFDASIKPLDLDAA